MNLPEGALLEAIRRAIAKLAGEDDLTILRVTGGNQIGRNRFSLPGDSAPGVAETAESLDDLLSYPDTEELFHDLVAKYALRSGVSGVQPKVMLDATERGTAAVGGYIVKSWGADYPQLAANEFFCMTAARRAGLPVPKFNLSGNGGLFVMKRFDLDDPKDIPWDLRICALCRPLAPPRNTAAPTSGWRGPSRIIVSGELLQTAREQFFASLVLSCMIRNGDAHLKNFGVLYEQPGQPVRLAPVYDMVTTVAYIPKDVPALSLTGTKKWWPRKVMEKFAVSHLALPVGKIGQIFDEVADGVNDTQVMLSAYVEEHAEFQDVGKPDAGRLE